MDINAASQEALETWKEKGWLDNGEQHPLVYHMLMVSELSEATECVRRGDSPSFLKDGKPEGELTELADCMIRIMQYSALRGWDLAKAIREKMDYNKTRSRHHGGKTCG